MNDYRVLKIVDSTMLETDQRIAEIELSEVIYSGFDDVAKNQKYKFSKKGELFVIDYSSELTKSIILSAQNQSIISIDLSEFRKVREFNNGQPVEVHYHKNVTLIDFGDKPDSYTKKQIDLNFLCKICRTDIHLKTPIGLPKEMFLGISQLKEMLQHIEINCNYCGASGLASDESKFELVKSNGLDEDLTPNLTSYEKREWYRSLDFIFQHYLKEIFEINIYENTGFAVDFYQCRFVLKKTLVNENKTFNLVFYNTNAIILQNGTNKIVEGKYPFMCKFNFDDTIPEEFIINPKNYTANEIRINIKNGGSIPFPLLEKKIE